MTGLVPFASKQGKQLDEHWRTNMKGKEWFGIVIITVGSFLTALSMWRCEGSVAVQPNPVVSLMSIAPTSATPGGAAFTLTVNGANFEKSSTVNWNGSAHTTMFVSATQITSGITAADIATSGTAQVTVANPPPGGGNSAAVPFPINPANNPAPSITSLSPGSATAGEAGFTLTVNGTHFVGSSVVNWNGAARTTTFVSATQVTAAISMTDILTAGTAQVTVTNPAPGGGTSPAVAFDIVSAANPVPMVSNISPSSATAGGARFTLMVNGTNFISA
jgi:hypothetical protein